MIKKYNSFLVKKLISQLYSVMDAYVYGSTDFIMKFKEISKVKGKTGEIAQGILDIIEDEEYIDDDDIKQNYFDLVDKDDMLSFIQQNRIPSGWDSDEDPSLPYTMKGRSDVKIGKIVRYLLPFTSVNFKDKDIEEFVNHFKAIKSNSKLKFELVDGSDIAKYYNSDRYYSSNGSLGGSCMADESKGTFKIYTENKSKVKLLVLLDEDNKVHGRALVWKLKDSPCEAKYFMDRVYTNRDSDVIKFKMYGDEKGFLQKEKMNSYLEDNVIFTYKGTDLFGEITVKLDGEWTNYPFVDTMCFLDEKKKLLSNLSGINTYFLHSVSGDCDRCDGCDGECIDCDDCKYSDGRYDCDDCDGTGETETGSKCVTCKGEGDIICEHKDATLCPDCSIGHETLLKKGIETNINKRFKKK